MFHTWLRYIMTDDNELFFNYFQTLVVDGGRADTHVQM